jgi:probable blue pigment (indigoidine) exporter
MHSATSLRLTALTALAPALWGTTYLVTTQWLPPDRPLLAGTLRALPAGLLLIAVGRRLPRGEWWWKAGVLGALNIGVFFALLFFAAYRLPGGVAATLGAVQPLVVAGLSIRLLGDRLRARTVVAGLFAVLGVALLVLRASARLDPAGVVAGLAATAAMALGVVLTKRWGRPVPLLTFTGWQLTVGGLLLAPVMLAVEGLPAGLSAVNIGGFAYLALVNTALGYVLWFRGLERLPAARVSFLGLLSPVVAAAAGWLVLDQSLTGWQLLGVGLALGSLVAAQRTPTGRPRMPRATIGQTQMPSQMPSCPA